MRRLLTALPVLTALVLAACASADSPPVAPPRDDAAAVAELSPVAAQRLLERAASGLLYTSESDYPFAYYFQPGPAPTPLDAAAFRAIAGVPADSAVEMISLDDFFARHIERVDPADSLAVALVPRYVALRETLRRVAHEPRVFRVGRIAIHCYVVGTDREGNVLGLTTVAIET